MKHFIFLAFILYSTFALCQEKMQKNNFHYNFYYDSITPLDYPQLKNYLFTISNLQNLDSFNNPNYLFIEEKKTTNFQITDLHFSKRNLFLRELNESQTLLFYSIGGFNLQILNIHHSQKITKNISGQIQYKRNKADGFYLNQKNQNDYLDVNLCYTIDQKKYSVLPYFKFIGKKTQENGGISSDSTFKTGDFNNSLILETNLNQAYNNWEIYDGGIDQLIQLNKIVIRDNISYRYQERNYIDVPDTNFYNFIFNDSTLTYDRLIFNGFHHDISFLVSKNKLKLIFEIESDLSEYKNNSIDTSHFQNKIIFNADKLLNNQSIKLKTSYTITGYNKNNFSAYLNYNYFINNKLKKILFDGEFHNYITDIKYRMIDLNNHYWNNSLNNSTNILLKIGLKSVFGDLFFVQNIFNNYVLLNEHIIPIQIASVKKIEINYQLEFKKKKHEIMFNAKYQNVFENENFFRVPEFLIELDYSFNLKLKSMDTKFGIHSFYFTEYFANGYDPSLNDFYLQNEITSGNYPFFDFYFQATIKTVDIKLMINHFNSGFTGFNYYTTPLYPKAPRFFQIAFSWLLKD